MYMSKSLEQSVAAYDDKSLRSAVRICNSLEQNGFTIKDIESYFNEIREEDEKGRKAQEAELERQRKMWEDVAPLCPDCGEILPPPRKLCGKEKDSNKNGWSCQWYCGKGWKEDIPSGICGWEKYTYQNAQEEMNKLMERRT